MDMASPRQVGFPAQADGSMPEGLRNLYGATEQACEQVNEQDQFQCRPRSIVSTSNLLTLLNNSFRYLGHDPSEFFDVLLKDHDAGALRLLAFTFQTAFGDD